MEPRESIETVVIEQTTETKKTAIEFQALYEYKMQKHKESIKNADHPFLSVENIKYVSAINEYWKNQKDGISGEKVIENNNDFQNHEHRQENDINNIANFARDFEFENAVYLDPEKQIEYEEELEYKEMEW